MSFKCHRIFAKILTVFLPLNSNPTHREYRWFHFNDIHNYSIKNNSMRLISSFEIFKNFKDKKFTRQLIGIKIGCVNSSSLGNGLIWHIFKFNCGIITIHCDKNAFTTRPIYQAVIIISMSRIFYCYTRNHCSFLLIQVPLNYNEYEYMHVWSNYYLRIYILWPYFKKILWTEWASFKWLFWGGGWSKTLIFYTVRKRFTAQKLQIPTCI